MSPSPEPAALFGNDNIGRTVDRTTLAFLATYAKVPVNQVEKATGGTRIVYGFTVSAKQPDGSRTVIGTFPTEDEAIDAEILYNDTYIPGWRGLRSIQHGNTG